MKSFITLSFLAALASIVSSQAINGCDENYSGTFEIAPYNVTNKIPQQVEIVCTNNPVVSLKNGVLIDQNRRIGEVVHNHQFQFDNPVQGPITSGFCVYFNGSLALHGSAIWYDCARDNFSNLYDQEISVGEGSQCHQVYIVAYPCSGSGATPVASGGASSTSSSSNTQSTNALSISASVPSAGTTASPLHFAAASPTEPTALPSISAAEPSTHETASSALSSSTKADVGVGVAVGVSLAGVLLYFLGRRLRSQPQRDMAHAGTSTNAGVTMSGSRQYEKPELTGEDTRKEMDAAERRKAELPGEETVMEMEATPAEKRIIHELMV